MNFKKTMFALAIGSVGIMGAMSAHAATVSAGDILHITAGVKAYDGSGTFTNVSSGSWFGMDTHGSGRIPPAGKVALSEGTTGLVIGTVTAAGASHGGAPTASDTNAITAPWEWFGNTGSDFTAVAITGNTETGLDFSGWTWAWNGVVTSLGADAWSPLKTIPGMAAGPYTDGVAKFNWDGTNGGAYTLDYLARVPLGDASGFGGVGYALHLEGTVTQAVPEASTYGMMLAGLGLVGFAASRRRTST